MSCFEIERKALLDFKASIFDPVGNLSSWIGQDCCRWKGVRCSAKTNHVISLNLRNSFLAYSFDYTSDQRCKISPSLVDLKYLSYFDISGTGSFNDKIPDFFGCITSLRYLNISNSGFSGSIPQSFGNLSNLEYLDLHSSPKIITLSILESDMRWLNGLSSLKHLNLDYVDLSRADSNWLHSINTFPSLLEFHFSHCQLHNLPPSLPYVNFSSLLVLNISYNNFNSTIPQWLFNLSSLTQLDLSNNYLQGVIPDAFWKLSTLELLDLSFNDGIEGKLSSSLGKLCHLKNLDLSYNKITGDITEFIDSLSQCSNNSFLQNLQYLSLQSNLLSGSIPESIGNLSALKILDLSYNQMRGKITTNLGKLSSLEYLYLEENSWEGIITEDHLVNLSSLQTLRIGKRSSTNITLVFNISSEWVPPFKLIDIRIYSCRLDEFPKWLKNQTELTRVVLNRTMMSGTIPEWFWKLNLELSEFDVADNQLTGKVSNSLRFLKHAKVDLSSNLFEGHFPLWSSSNLSWLYMGDNLFSGAIPPDIGIRMPNLKYLNISHNFLDGSIPISLNNMTQLKILVISNNWLDGSIPISLSNMIRLKMLVISNNRLDGSIPISLRYMTSLKELDISNNRLSGEVPQIWDNLYIVDMSNNNLIGLLPNSNGSCNLRFLRLSGNKLFGKVPSAFENCFDMVSFDIGDNRISGNLPAWIAENMPHLLILRVRNNSLTGNIPFQLCHLFMLHILDLSKNNFSGSIPQCIGNMYGFQTTPYSFDYWMDYVKSLQVNTKGRIFWFVKTQVLLMYIIDLSENRLSGEIPATITSLRKLDTLNLSMNHLTGMIPSDIGSLTALESLDLSVNRLSGPIPTSMTSLNFLNHLNLSHNNLSGLIPTAGQFKSLNDPSNYVGNAALCGDPLTAKCFPGEEEEESQKHEGEEEEDNDDLEKITFFGIVGLGIFSGFWGFFGTLILKKSWRYAYFNFLQRMIDKMYVMFFLLVKKRF